MSFLHNFQAVIEVLIQLIFIFPYSVLTISRQRQLPPVRKALHNESPTQISKPEKKETIMISDKVYKLCTSKESVSALLAQNPTMAPSDAWKKLYGGHSAGEKESKSTARAHRDAITQEDLQRAYECGNWGPTRPSELFLRMYHDALCTLDKSVSGCMVSPSLMGSCGVIPLTVISVVPDIMRHMSNLIVRAEKEVILATNYWQNSVASKYITDAMLELSRRAGERGERIVFKVEYDRGSAKQLIDNHHSVSEKEYLDKAVALPAPNEIPNIDLQVINYHKPMLGTFHCKYMVVDRKYAVLQSNNIQDNDNMEMMTHLEGPIVDSLYDMALISWSKKLEPPLPSHNSPAVHGGLGAFGPNHDDMFAHDGSLKGHSAIVHPDKMGDRKAYAYESNDTKQPGVVPNSTTNVANGADILTGPSTLDSITHPASASHPTDHGVDGIANETANLNVNENGNGNGDTYKAVGPTESGVNRTGNENPNLHTHNEDAHHGFEGQDLGKRELISENARAAATTGDIEHIVHSKDDDHTVSNNGGQHAETAVPQTTNNDNGATSANGQTNGGALRADAQTQAFLGSGTQIIPHDQIQEPVTSSELLPEHTTDDPHYDVDIAGEVARVQTAVSPKAGETRIEAVTRHLNHIKNVGFKGNAPECAPHEEMTPYIPHPVHEPFPIAMVCREPYGTPNHTSVYNPQNEVWLSALRNAKKNVFIQSPTLNAEPLVPAIIEACERGIDVYCYICLGYNDTGELLPMQGGTNEMISHKLHTSLSAEGKQHLHYFFYTSKDLTHPIVAKMKKRDCHVKVMIVDERIGIQGNGNQDTQSWFHSQEINVMFESESVCKGWIDALRRNQNTHIYGRVGSEDGIWRDEAGKEAEGVIGVDPGRFSWAKGFLGAINRVRGVGDF